MSQDHTNNEGRRRFLKVAAGSMAAAAVVGLVPRSALAADLPPVTPADPTAAALQYTDNAATAKGRKAPTDACSNCTFYHGGAAGRGPCDLFPGKSVAAAGWCVSHSAKG
ncbi:proline racemase [Luteibacter sp. Sphag1AF]|uniref:high-potential iron-sulfur protein n=1 Tax=Luteibacter sp. Sphag1AF TaxID=2587031 RepID=UPI00160C3717|nr:high-potential iron-sulfur protein [Luteibacter sp. Sphag1AF]MBB3228608.1 proline racemase [Luteibacter sp. Sphag1AF]